jgi:hypothetical protein
LVTLFLNYPSRWTKWTKIFFPDAPKVDMALKERPVLSTLEGAGKKVEKCPLCPC